MKTFQEFVQQKNEYAALARAAAPVAKQIPQLASKLGVTPQGVGNFMKQYGPEMVMTALNTYSQNRGSQAAQNKPDNHLQGILNQMTSQGTKAVMGRFQSPQGQQNPQSPQQPGIGNQPTVMA